MKYSYKTALFVCLSIVLSCRAMASEAQELAFLPIEAEASVNLTGAHAKADAMANGQTYAMHPENYNPVLQTDVPEGSDSLTTWIRARGGSYQLKAIAPETAEQTELVWLWEMGPTWTWRKFGTFSKEQLGEQILVIRGEDNDMNGGAGIDLVLFCNSDSFDPSKSDAWKHVKK